MYSASVQQSLPTCDQTQHDHAQDQVVADLGLGSLQLAQLDAGKALVRQGLHNGHKGVQILGL